MLTTTARVMTLAGHVQEMSIHHDKGGKPFAVMGGVRVEIRPAAFKNLGYDFMALSESHLSY